MSDTEDNKPLFLRAQDPSTWEKPEDVSHGDWFLRPDKPLSARHRVLAKMVAMGCGTNEIAEKLGYTASRVSILKSNTKIKEAIERYQDRMHEEDLEDRIKSLGPDALDTIEEILSSNADPLKKESAARWILEKISGKASQQIDVTGEIGIGVFMEKLDKIKVAQRIGSPILEARGQSTESAPEPESTKDPIEDWLDKNLTD